MNVTRTALIGLGRIGWKFHLPRIVQHDGFDLVAVVDPLVERLQEAGETFGAKGYQTYQELLAKEQLDLVVIASPTPFHAEQALASFEHGCDVFCDKPLAPSLEESERMVECMRKHSRKMMVYQPHRVIADIVALKFLIKKDLIGPIYMIQRGRSGYDRRNDWQSLKKFGGGMLNNYGAHYIDQLLYLCDSRPKKVFGLLRTVASAGDAEDVVKVVIEMEDGRILDLDINMACPHSMVPWQILGKYGSILFDEQLKATS